MPQVSIELVPRSLDLLQQQLRLIKQRFPAVNTINIPDQLRLPIRSWQGCAEAILYQPHAIPHIRAVDFPDQPPTDLLDYCRQHGLKELLIVSGDAPPDQQHKVYNNNAVALIHQIKQTAPAFHLYAAIDPYRSELSQELDYVAEKLEAGADGFFTQPFFDRQLLQHYAEALAGQTVFWGASPVLNAKSQQYWQSRNRVSFPDNFEPTLAWNRHFAKQLLAFVRQRGDNIYFMPIRTDIGAYLSGILDT